MAPDPLVNWKSATRQLADGLEQDYLERVGKFARGFGVYRSSTVVGYEIPLGGRVGKTVGSARKYARRCGLLGLFGRRVMIRDLATIEREFRLEIDAWLHEQERKQRESLMNGTADSSSPAEKRPGADEPVFSVEGLDVTTFRSRAEAERFHEHYDAREGRIHIFTSDGTQLSVRAEGMQVVIGDPLGADPDQLQRSLRRALLAIPQTRRSLTDAEIESAPLGDLARHAAGLLQSRSFGS